MEGRVFVCSWKKVGTRYRVWVTKRPKLAATGESFEAADEALWDVIMRATDDGENTREYDPPPPVDPELAKFLQPRLLVIQGNDYTTVNDPGTLFEGERCAKCGFSGGKRTGVSFFCDEIDGGSDAGVGRIVVDGVAKENRHYFSEDFLRLLKPRERDAFEWIKVERPVRAKKAFYELVSSRVTLPRVGVKGLDSKGGSRCASCGFTVLPGYGSSAGWPLQYVCSDDLPEILPTCFAIDRGYELALCVQQKRWREMVGKTGAKGLISDDVGVVGPDRCVRNPKVRVYENLHGEKTAFRRQIMDWAAKMLSKS